MAECFRWDHAMYDMVAHLCIALTNIHIQILPLRSEDGLYLKFLAQKQQEMLETRATREKQWRETPKNNAIQRMGQLCEEFICP